MKKVLVNTCYGGFGYSDEFVTHMKSLGYEEIERDNPIVVEEFIKFGQNKASGEYSRLRIDEIHDKVQYSIGEYDGQEWIDSTWIEVTIEELMQGLSEDKIFIIKESGCMIKIVNNFI